MAKQPVKRRKWKRFAAKDGAVVFFHKSRLLNIGKPKLVKFGPLIDISMGGLSIQYIEKKDSMEEVIELSVEMPPHGMKLEAIPFVMACDHKVTELPNSQVIRNRCVKFGELNHYQTFQLKEFINKFTIKLTEDRRREADRRKYDHPDYADGEWRIKEERRSGKDRRKYTR